MIAILTTLALLGGGAAGSQLGLLRGACAALAALLGGLLGFNWGLGVANSLSGGAPGPRAALCLVFCAAGFVALYAGALASLRGDARAPRLWDRYGGAALGMAVGWLLFGQALASLRALPAVEGFVHEHRGGPTVDPATADGWWLDFVQWASDRGLAQDPPAVFDPRRDHLPAP
jgi:hypothetical protein